MGGGGREQMGKLRTLTTSGKGLKALPAALCP